MCRPPILVPHHGVIAWHTTQQGLTTQHMEQQWLTVWHMVQQWHGTTHTDTWYNAQHKNERCCNERWHERWCEDDNSHSASMVQWHGTIHHVRMTHPTTHTAWCTMQQHCTTTLHITPHEDDTPCNDTTYEDNTLHEDNIPYNNTIPHTTRGWHTTTTMQHTMQHCNSHSVMHSTIKLCIPILTHTCWVWVLTLTCQKPGQTCTYGYGYGFGQVGVWVGQKYPRVTPVDHYVWTTTGLYTVANNSYWLAIREPPAGVLISVGSLPHDIGMRN